MRVPAGAKCAYHGTRDAQDTCERCGNYVCAGCYELDEQVRTYCVQCFDKVGARAPHSGRATTAFVLAFLAMSGCLPLAVPAVILGHMELSAIDRGEALPGGRNLALGAVILGWILSVVTLLAVVFVAALAVGAASL